MKMVTHFSTNWAHCRVTVYSTYAATTMLYRQLTCYIAMILILLLKICFISFYINFHPIT